MSRASLITKLLADLYDRQRPAASSRNKLLQKYLFMRDSITTADTYTPTLRTPPFRYAPTAGTKLRWGQGQYR